MKAVLKTKPGEGFTYITNHKEPGKLINGWVKVRMIYSSICGTDVHIYKWDEWAQNNIKTPQVNGHEGVGQVEEIGSGVSNVKVGDYVAYETHNYCGKCHVCKQGNIHVCKNMTILGVHIDGTWAEKIIIPAKILFKLPKNRKFPLKYCGILEPFGNAHHTLSYTELKKKNVLISGDGPIGIFGALIAKARGAKRVFITGANTHRINIAKKCKLDVIDVRKLKSKNALAKKLNTLTNEEGIDVVGEFSGAAVALKNAIDIVNPGGYLGILSLYPVQQIELPVNELVFKNIQAQFVCGRKIFKTWEEGFDLINSGKVKISDIKNVISHEIPLKDYEKGFKAILDKKASKVLLKIGKDTSK